MAKQNKAFEFGPFRLEVRERRLTREGHTVPLRGRVFDTLYVLISRHGCLVTKDELMAAVWPESVVEETNLNHNICVLRRALGEKATGQKYVETVPRQGYRFVAEVQELENQDAESFSHHWKIGESVPADRRPLLAVNQPPSGFASHQEAPGGRKDLRPLPSRPWYSPQRMVSLLAVSVLFVATYVGVEQFGFRGGLWNSRVMLAVLPFENLTGDSSQKYIADGFSHEIISQLGRWNSAKLGVISHPSSKAYRGTVKPISEIGGELGVDYIVEGSVRRYRNRYRITVMLIRADDQVHVWAANYDRDAGNVMALQVEVTQAIIREIASRISVEPAESSLMAYPLRIETCENAYRFLPAAHTGSTSETELKIPS